MKLLKWKIPDRCGLDRATVASLGLLIVLPAIFFWRETLGWLTLGDQDAVFWFFPAYQFFAEQVKAGQWPIWSPYLYSGTPLFAQWQAGMLDPLNWVYLFGATSRTLTVSLELSFSLSLLSTFSYCRAIGLTRRAGILAAIIYSLSGFAVARTLYPGFLHIYALAPLVLTMTERLSRRRCWSDVALGAMVIAWQVLAAHPQPLIYSSLLACGYALLKRKETQREPRGWWNFALKFCSMFVLGAGLAAIQLLPAWEIANESVRREWPFEMFTLHSIHPASLLTALIPFFHGAGRAIYQMPYWGISWHHNESQIYLGALALSLAIGGALTAARRRDSIGIFWTVVATIGVVLVLGKYAGPVARLLYHAPAINHFRSPNRHWMEVALAVAVLAGYAVDRLIKEAESATAASVRAASIGLTVMTAFVCGAVLWRRETAEHLLRSLPDWQGLPSGFLQSARLEFALPMITASVFTLVLFLWLRSSNRARWYFALPVLLLADYQLYAFYAPINHPAGLEHRLGRAIPPEPAGQSDPYRWHVMLSAAQGEFSPFWFYGHEMITGYDPLLNDHYKNFSGIDEAGRGYLATMLQSGDCTLDLLNTRFVMIPPDWPDPPNDPARWRETSWRSPVPTYADYRIYENLRALPRAWLVGRIEEAWEGDQLKLMRGELLDRQGKPFDPRAAALVDVSTSGEKQWYGSLMHREPSSDGPPGEARIVHRQADRMTIETDSARPSVLVLSEVANPGWKVWIDGKQGQWHRVNYMLRGVPLPAGSHRVEFAYRPDSIKIGAAISIIAALVLGILVKTRPNTC